MRVKIFSIVIILVMLGGCQVNDNKAIEYREESQEYIFKVYNSINNVKAADNLRLLFSHEDIRVFDWENQRIFFNSNVDLPDLLEGSFKKPYVGSEIFNTGNFDKFLVFVNDELIYEGYYVQSTASSYLPMGITMTDEVDGVSFVCGGIVGGEDSRFDQRILEAIKTLDLLEE